MPTRTMKTHMIVKTNKGLVLVDKDGNQRPLTEKEMKKAQRKIKERK